MVKVRVVVGNVSPSVEPQGYKKIECISIIYFG